jgi:hypothetical protein
MKLGDEIMKLIQGYLLQEAYAKEGKWDKYQEASLWHKEQVEKLNEIVVIEQGR